MSSQQPNRNGRSRKNRNNRHNSDAVAKSDPLQLLRLEDRLTPNTGVPVPPGALSGFVYVDDNNDGIKQAAEQGIGGVTVSLIRILAGVTTTVGSTTTAADGSYRFTNLNAGTGYRVVETQPSSYSDGKDTAGSTGGDVSVNDVISGAVVPAGGESLNNNFGELIGAISGFVYLDADDDGIKDAGEAPIPGTTVTLVRTLNGVDTTVGQTTTGADGSYSFGLLLLDGTYRVVETQPAGFADGKDTPGTPGGGSAAVNDQIQTITLTANGRVSPNNNFGERPVPPPPAAQLSGFVYEDTDDDGIKDAGEAPIPGTTITLVQVGNGVTTTIGSTTTGASGEYAFTNLTPGSGYRVVETQPAGYNDGKDTPGSTGGTNTVNDQLDAITLAPGANSQNNNFGERVIPQVGSLSGFVYEDDDNDGVKDGNEAPVAGTTVTLIRVVNGVTSTIGSTTTGADGSYSFANLTPGGGYRVVEGQPANYLDGKDTIGSTGGTVSNDQLDGITVPANGASVNNNFGELKPAQLSGFVYRDFGSGTAANDDNGVKNTGETGIAGVTVTLTGIDDLGAAVSRTTSTGADGSYSFGNLRPGTYAVNETQPAGFVDGKDTIGTINGVPSNGLTANDAFSGIALVAGNNSPNNNFGELPVPPPPPGTIGGVVYEDDNDDGVKQTAEAPIPGATVTLIRVLNGVTTTIASTTTGADGSYLFTGLTPGDGYRIVETQPAGYADGKDTAGSTGGDASVNDTISSISVPAGGSSVNNNFGERLGQISGFVYFDADDDGVKDAGEAPIPGTTVSLVRVVNGVTTTIASTTTGTDGSYLFDRLPVVGGYRIVETQPAGFADGKDTPGSVGGGTSTVNDQIDAVALSNAARVSPNNNFGERPLPPAVGSLSGFVYKDADDDGIKDAGELALADVTVTLYRPSNTPGVLESVTSTVTEANGAYSFTNLAPGQYWVNETQPAGYVDGKDTPGAAGGVLQVNDWISAIPVVAGQNSPDNNFGERKLGLLSGFVYRDPNDNGVKEAGEGAISGVTVTLYRPTNTSGVLESVTSTVTDVNGAYRFDNLAPGQYWVQESQPAGFLDGKDTVGNTSGVLQVNDWISAITVPEGESANNNFGELVPGSLSGFVYRDFGGSGTRDNGVKEAGETGIAGVTITLYRPSTTPGVLEVVATTTTAADGSYSFIGLVPGIYWVQEGQPAGFADGKDTPGSAGGVLQVNDWISAIPVAAGQNSPNNNFGELISTDEQPPTQNPQSPLPPVSKQNFLGSST